MDGTGRYLVLDGANRVTALKKMNFPHALVQIVKSDDPGLQLDQWNHVVWEIESEKFLEPIQRLSVVTLDLIEKEEDEFRFGFDYKVAFIKLNDFNTLAVTVNSMDLEEQVDILNQIVNTYQYRCRLDRTYLNNVQSLKEIYPQFAGLIVFPHLSKQDVMDFAGRGILLPSGITRFSISPRALHLNYPLQKIEENRPIEDKNIELQDWIHERIAQKAVRYYAEPTVLYDE
jgi:hypothetical protein